MIGLYSGKTYLWPAFSNFFCNLLSRGLNGSFVAAPHVLNLIDDMRLRKAIRSARNRTEAYHPLQGNIRRTYSGVFQGKKIVENRISAHAARLIANCIIAYNSMILNTVYQKMLSNGVAQEIIDEFTRISPIAWTHTLFTGRYSFKKNNGNIDVEAMARIMEDHLKQHFWSEN
jgi:hypothetical protein